MSFIAIGIGIVGFFLYPVVLVMRLFGMLEGSWWIYLAPVYLPIITVILFAIGGFSFLYLLNSIAS